MFYTIGDVHLGKRFKSKDIPLAKKGLREQILKLRFQQAVARAVKQVQKGGYKGIVFMGDLFDSFCVSYEDILVAYDTLKTIPANIPTFIIAGNHDLSKNDTRISALQILAMLMKGFIHIIFVINDAFFSNGGRDIFVPYKNKDNLRPFIESQILAVKNIEGPYRIYGHFEEEDFPWLLERFPSVYSGHIHAPRQEGNLTVVGSIMPFTFAEDPTNTFMKTCTLAEYEEDVKNGAAPYRCYRLKLQDGETMPDSATADCLQLSRYTGNREVEQEDLSVSFETFDLEKLMHEALDTLGVFQEFYDLYTRLKLEESDV